MENDNTNSSPQPTDQDGGNPQDVAQPADTGSVTDGKSLLGGDDGSKAGEQPKYEGAPEKYEFANPEGKEYDPAFLGEYEKVARELDFSQTKAQTLIDKMAPVIQQRQMESIKQEVSRWGETSRNDPEFGGNNLDENLGVATAALAKYGSPELKQLLNHSGLGDHPEIIRLLFRVGKELASDKIVTGSGARGDNSTGDKFGDIANRMYKD